MDVNYLLIKNFITKNYIISNVHSSMPCFNLFSRETGESLSEWVENDIISKIFSVDNMFVKKIFKELAVDALYDKLKK